MTENPHTDQYLLWTSEHPTTHKLSVVRALYDRANIITDDKDRQGEEQHIKNVLTHCLDPGWAINKGRRWVQNNIKEDKKMKKRTSSAENQGMVTLLYIRGVTERIQRVMRKHRMNTPEKPYTKLHQILVHPKDQIDPEKKCNVIYEIPC